MHAEAASEALRTRLLRDVSDTADLRIAVTVNSTLSLAEANGRLATGIGSVGTVGGALTSAQSENCRPTYLSSLRPEQQTLYRLADA